MRQLSLTDHGPVLTAPTLAAAEQFTALADISALLDRAPNDAAVGSGVRHIFEARPLPGLRCALGPGSSGEDVARLIGSLLVALPVPFTKVIGSLTREHPRIEALPCGRCETRCRGHERRLTGAEAATLGVADDIAAAGWHRDGLMMTGTTIAADTAVTLLPRLVPAGLMDMIRDGTPAGAALPDLRRTGTSVRLRWPLDPGLLVSAVLVLNGQRAGVTSERVTCAVLDRLAKAAS
jgi:hypothetical protein